MSKSAKVSGSVVAGFPSPAEQYQETPLDLNELLKTGVHVDPAIRRIRAKLRGKGGGA